MWNIRWRDLSKIHKALKILECLERNFPQIYFVKVLMKGFQRMTTPIVLHVSHLSLMHTPPVCYAFMVSLSNWYAISKSKNDTSPSHIKVYVHVCNLEIIIATAFCVWCAVSLWDEQVVWHFIKHYNFLLFDTLNLTYTYFLCMFDVHDKEFVACLYPKMINFDFMDFSECCTKE